MYNDNFLLSVEINFKFIKYMICITRELTLPNINRPHKYNTKTNVILNIFYRIYRKFIQLEV